jgi:hypothetical protein
MKPEPDSQSLREEDFIPLALNGWGDAWNAYVHSMVRFEDHLYCGTFRAQLCLKRWQKGGPPPWPVWPIQCPRNVYSDLDMRAQIWRFSLSSGHWENIYRSPIVDGKDGRPIPREFGYRGMAVLHGKSDVKPTLYVTGFSSTRSLGPLILRSEDGHNFQAVCRPGLGLGSVSAFRFLVPFKDRVYTSPIGSTGNIANQSKYPVVFESRDPASGNWRPVSHAGFGDKNNTVVFSMAEFNGQLYAGTFNHVDGFQLWKTAAEGTPPYNWQKVIDLGAGRRNLNEGALALCEFRGALYVGTCIQEGGYDRLNGVGPAAAEIIRVYADDSWDLIVGEPRRTKEGLKFPVSGFGPGFDNLFNGYLWSMCVHDDELYAGTLSSAVYLPYLGNEADELRSFIETDYVQEFLASRSGLEIWSSADGNSWGPVTTTGFGNRYNNGARTLVSTPSGLAVGTVNPFGPQVAVKQGESWAYETNHRGGAEVWFGSRHLSKEICRIPPFGGREMRAVSVDSV